MAADINDIVCLGYGSWSSVNTLPTLGFGAAAVVVPTKPGLEFTLPESRMHFAMPESRMHFGGPEE